MLVDIGGRALKTEIGLTRDEFKLFRNLETLLERLDLAFCLRCRKCNARGHQDGVWGAKESDTHRYVMECACTKRSYNAGH